MTWLRTRWLKFHCGKTVNETEKETERRSDKNRAAAPDPKENAAEVAAP